MAEGDPPTIWWGLEADKSLLVGVFKHGYEKFNVMRSDPSLIFLALCGPPDGAALAAEQNDDDDGNGKYVFQCMIAVHPGISLMDFMMDQLHG